MYEIYSIKYPLKSFGQYNSYQEAEQAIIRITTTDIEKLDLQIRKIGAPDINYQMNSTL